MSASSMPVEIHDLRYEAPDALSPLQRYFLPRLRDERDLVLIDRMMKLTLRLAIPGLLMFLPGVAQWWMTPFYLVWFIVNVGPYVLLLHCLSHRRTFAKGHEAWAWYVPYVLGPFYGQTPGSYYAHHLGMHHAEGNLLTDLSTTMPYRRDSFAHWLHYMVRFAIGSFTNFPRYFIQRGRTKMMRRWVAGEAAWAVLVLGAWWLNPLAATIVFIMPLVTIRTLFMCGNWGQHAFVDVDDANNPYRNSTCLLNHRYNRRCFNDGYHIVHHLRPAMHWEEMPKFFEANWERFAAEDAIVFDGLGSNQTVWWCLMLGRYDKLAEHLVQWPGKERTMAERIAFLQSRTRGQRGRIRGIFEAGPVPAPKGRKPSGGEAVAA